MGLFVPGITATRENLKAIVDFLFEAGADDVSLLPYNPMGLEMTSKIGKPKPHLPEQFMKPAEEKEIYVMFKALIEENAQRQ
jgi:pyruvate-formate lyase-activating enzyme